MKNVSLLSGSIVVALLAVAAPAQAGQGCNGYVNLAVWGCAPWDNNNGPKFPHYRGSAGAPAKPAAPAKPQPSVTSGLLNRNGSGIVAQGGGN